MASVNYKNLLALYEHKPLKEATAQLKEGFAAKAFRPQDFDLGRLFCECFGWNEFQACKQDGRLVNDLMVEYRTAMTEAGNTAVSTNAFSNISGQIVYSAIMEAFMMEEYQFSRLIPEVQTEFNGEKIAGITGIGDETQIVAENDPYPFVGVSEDFIETPITSNRGMIVPISRAAIFFDRTGVLLDRCSKVGEWAGLNKEKRAIDCTIDENDGASALATSHRYKWRGAIIQTYGDNAGTHSWDNLAATNALVDWTDLDVAEQLLNEITDPNTGEPVMVEATHLIVTKSLEQTASRILNATMINVVTPGYATTGNPTETTRTNPMLNKYTLLTTRLLAARLGTDTSWFLGNPAKAFRYMVNWPLQTIQAPANSHDEFHRDIVQQYRVSERGAYSTWEPRLMCKSTVA